MGIAYLDLESAQFECLHNIKASIKSKDEHRVEVRKGLTLTWQVGWKVLKVTKATEECCHHRHRPVTPKCSLFQAQLAALPCHVLSFLRRYFNFLSNICRAKGFPCHLHHRRDDHGTHSHHGLLSAVLYRFGILKSVAPKWRHHFLISRYAVYLPLLIV